MSVKFEKETIKQQGSAQSLLGKDKHHGVAHELGERLTGGETAKGYLAVRRRFLRESSGGRD